MYEKYIKELKEHNIKITSQRLEILKYLDEHHTHPDADHIYSELKKNHPSLSRTTVYNALEILKKKGMIQSLTISGSELRYDISRTQHHHFLCKECQKILDIEIQCPNINRTIADGHHVEEVHGYFKGICKQCLKRERGRKVHGYKNVA